MSTYITQDKPIDFDNAPDWLIGFLQYIKTMRNCTNETVKTYFLDLRGFFQWASFFQKYHRNPKDKASLHNILIYEYPISEAIKLKRADIETYLFFLDNTLKNTPVTRNKKLASIKTFYDYILIRQQDIGIVLDSNPASLIKQAKIPKKNPVYITPEDQVRLLDATAGEMNEIRDKAIFLVMDTTGIRNSELCGLNVQDMDLVHRNLRIRKAKGNKERYVFLTDACAAVLQRYLDEYRSAIDSLDTDALFVSKRTKKRLTSRLVQRTQEKYNLKAGLGNKGYTPHKHRHAVATTLIKEGKSQMAVKELLGHESISTTQKYTHLDDMDIRNAVNTSGLASLGLETGME